MKINYTVTTYSCPNCGKTLKIENTLAYLLLAIIFFPLAIIYGVYWYVKMDLEGKLTCVSKVGNPFKTCPKCGTNVRINDKMLYEELPYDKKYIYDNRDDFQKCYITKTMVIVFGLTSLLVFSGGGLDFIVACISIPIAIASFFVFQSSKKKCQKIIDESKLKTNSQTKNNQKKQTLQSYAPQQRAYQDIPRITAYESAEKAQQHSIKFCRICGNKLTEDSVFCSKCGTKIIPEND